VKILSVDFTSDMIFRGLDNAFLNIILQNHVCFIRFILKNDNVDIYTSFYVKF